MSECQKRSNVATGLCQPGEAAVSIRGSHPQGRGAACRRSAIRAQNARVTRLRNAPAVSARGGPLKHGLRRGHAERLVRPAVVVNPDPIADHA